MPACMKKIDVKLDFVLTENETELFKLDLDGFYMGRATGRVDTGFARAISRFFARLSACCKHAHDNEKAMLVITDQRIVIVMGDSQQGLCCSMGAQQHDRQISILPVDCLNGWNTLTHNWGQGTCGCSKYDVYSLAIGYYDADNMAGELRFSTSSIKDPTEASALLAVLNSFASKVKKN